MAIQTKQKPTKEAKALPSIWKRYKVVLQFTGRLCGGVPMDANMLIPWLKSRMASEPRFRQLLEEMDRVPSIEEIAEGVAETLPDLEEQAEAQGRAMTLGFQQDERGLFVRGGNFRAHLKDCARVLAGILKAANALSSGQFVNKVYVEDDRLYLGRSEPDGMYDQPIHAWTPQGQINALKRVLYVEQPRLEFTLRVLNDDSVGEDILRAVFEYGCTHGFGGERKLGNGRYAVARLELLG